MTGQRLWAAKSNSSDTSGGLESIRDGIGFSQPVDHLKPIISKNPKLTDLVRVEFGLLM